MPGSMAGGNASIQHPSQSPRRPSGKAGAGGGRAANTLTHGSSAALPEAAAPSEAPPPFEGWLKKKSKGGVPGMRAWSRRYYLLDDRGLHWWDDDNKRGLGQHSCRGTIKIARLAGVEEDAQKGQARFVLNVRHEKRGPMHPKHLRMYELEADSPPMMKRWLDITKQHLNRNGEAIQAAQQGTNLRATLPTSAGSPMPVDEGGNPVKMTVNSWGQPVPMSTPMRSSTSLVHITDKSPRAQEDISLGAASVSASASSEPVADDATCTGEVLEARLAAIPGNAFCADCNTSDPTHYPNTAAWASTNLGTTFCIRCSGIHRKMGAHVTKVLSMRIDVWTEAQLQFMEGLGNDRVNAELEAQLPPTLSKPDLATGNMQELEAYIRAKYELGSFKVGGDGRLPAVEAALESHVGMVEFGGVLFIKLLMLSNPVSAKAKIYAEVKLNDRTARSKTWNMAKGGRWGEALSLNTKSTKETLIVKVYEEDMFGKGEFVGQAMVPIADLTHDGQPMGFDLTLDLSKAMSKKTEGKLAPSIGIELTYNSLGAS